MTDKQGPLLHERFLIFAATADAKRSILAEAGLGCCVCTGMATLCREIEQGAGGILLDEECLAFGQCDPLIRTLEQQPAWSDLPVLVLTRRGSDSMEAKRALETLGNVLLLERPLRATMLLSAVRSALRARRRQYELRNHLQSREYYQRQLEALTDQLEHRVAERTSVINLLHDVASAANQSDRVADIEHYVLARVCADGEWIFGHVFEPHGRHSPHLRIVNSFYSQAAEQFSRFRELSEAARWAAGEGLPGRVFTSSRPQWTNPPAGDLITSRDELAGELDIGTVAAFPVLIGQRVLAVLEFGAQEKRDPDERTLDVMSSVGTQVGRVMERKELHGEIAELTAGEKRRIGQELHDSVAQQLTGTAMLARTLRQAFPEHASPEGQSLDRLIEHIKSCQSQVRRVSRGLMPVEVDVRGLMSALQELADEYDQMTDLHCRFRCAKPVPVRNNTIATHLYYIAREAVHNAVKHAAPRHLTISLQADEGCVILTVSDDGGGFAGNPTTSRGMGQRIMQYRAGLMGARLHIDSAVGEGTTVTCTLKPIEDDETLHGRSS